MRRAGLLWGAVELDEREGPIGQWEGERDAYAAAVLERADTEFEAGRAVAITKTLDELVEFALADD